MSNSNIEVLVPLDDLKAIEKSRLTILALHKEGYFKDLPASYLDKITQPLWNVTHSKYQHTHAIGD